MLGVRRISPLIYFIRLFGKGLSEYTSMGKSLGPPFCSYKEIQWSLSWELFGKAKLLSCFLSIGEQLYTQNQSERKTPHRVL